MSSKNDNKSAVTTLQKGDWQERGPVTDECPSRSGKPVKRIDPLLIQGYEAAEVVFNLTEEFRHAETNARRKILRSVMFPQVNLISVAPPLQNLRIGLKRTQCGKSKVPAKQRGSWPKGVKIKGTSKRSIPLTFG